MNAPLPEWIGPQKFLPRASWPIDAKCNWCGLGRPGFHITFKGYECFIHSPCLKQMEVAEHVKSGVY